MDERSRDEAVDRAQRSIPTLEAFNHTARSSGKRNSRMDTHESPGSRVDLDRIEELAKAATPGPWAPVDGGGHSPWRHLAIRTIGKNGKPSHTGTIAQVYKTYDDVGANNASYIAACDPSTILQLVRDARAGRALTAAIDTATAPTPRCDGCRYWAEVVKRDLDDNERHPDDFWGECRRHPPRRRAPCDAQFTYAPDEFEFPSVAARQWCGEFRPKEAP